MAETGKQVKKEVKGMAETAAGAVTGDDELHDKGTADLDRAAELQREWNSSRAGTTKGSDRRDLTGKRE